LTASVVAIWIFDGVPEEPVRLVREKTSGSGSSSALNDRAASSLPAGAGEAANPVPPSVTPTTATDSPQPDPFKQVLNAQRNTLPPQQPTSTGRPLEDPFKQALEESNRRRAAAALSPFAESK
jgi:hypothetical protein